MSDEPWHNPGKWYVSPYNFAEETVAKFNFPPGRQIVVREPSLSDEPQGVRYSIRDKIEIAQKFDEAGVGEIFHHVHGVTQEKLDAMKTLCGLGLTAKVGAAIRVPSEPKWKEHMDYLIEGGIDEIQLYENTRARLDFAVPGKQDVLSTEQMIEKLVEGVEYAKKGGVLVSIGVGPRLWPKFSDFDFLMRVYNECIEAGAEKIWIYLSSPISPHGVEALVNRINKAIVKKVPFGIHTHNDYGLGVAAQIAAVLNGATHIEAYTNAMADRSGPPLEELAVALEMFYGVTTGIKLEKLYDLCTFVSKKSTIPFSPQKGVTGANTFILNEDKFIADFLRKETFKPLAYLWEGYLPSVIGRGDYKLVWDKHTLQGERGIRAKLEQMNLDYTDQDIKCIKEILREKIYAKTKYPMWLEEPEVENICRSVVDGSASRTSSGAESRRLSR
jgi:isopropylmalate/homocitrate/citramalate synthase